MSNTFVQALVDYKRAYDNWVRGGRNGPVPVGRDYGVTRFEAEHLRGGAQPIDVFNAMHYQIKTSNEQRRQTRGPAYDPRKKVKHTTRKHTPPTPKRRR